MKLAFAERWAWVPRVAAVAAAVLLLLGLLVISQSEESYREQEMGELLIEARILATTVTAALDFADVEAANEAVLAFRADNQIRVASVYDANGALLAGYGAPARLPEPSIVGDRVSVVEPVMRNARRVGAVYLVADIDPIGRRAPHYAVIGLLVVMAILVLVAFAFAQTALTRAYRELAATNRELEAQIEGREQAETQLRQSQKMEAIGQLTGGIAHDFNNMLAIVIGNLDMARRRFESAPLRARAGLDHAMEGAVRAAALTKRLLAFSRQQPLEPRVLDVNALVGGMSDLLRRTIGEQLRVETVLSGGLWRTHADPGQLENAILNLCVNARDAMEGGGRLTIETLNAALDDDYVRDLDGVAPGQYVAIAVSDTGPGMPPEVRERAFDPFFTTKSVGKGTGLGLSQVYGFVRQSDGHVRIYTELGRGTTVKIYLPRHLGAQEALAEKAVASELPHARPGELVLVVEDEDQVRRTSIDNLEELGYPVLEAANPEDALVKFGTRPDIALLFTDVVMPGMTGKELADRCREARPDLPVVFTTGYTRNAIVHNGVLDPDIAFLPKPFTLDQLARKVREALDGAQNNRRFRETG